MPSVTIYRPPAARKLEQNSNLSNLQSRETLDPTSAEKNKLNKCPDETKELKRSDANGMSVFRKAITSIHAQNKLRGCKNVEGGNRKPETVSNAGKVDEGGKNAVQNKQRRPDIQVYVPKGRRAATVLNNNSNNDKISSSNGSEDGSNNISSNEGNLFSENNCGCKSDAKPSVAPLMKKEDDFPGRIEVITVGKEDPASESRNLSKGNSSEVRQESVGDVPEIISSTVSDPVSEISSQCEENSHECSVGAKDGLNSCKKRLDENPLNPDECDWETMFDDTGECLDPSLLEQLTSAVGEVTIEKPESRYEEFKTKSLDVMADEFPHVIEIYNFPPEFQIQDLMMVFSQFKNSGFEIKWVDDTHALGVFSSSAVVSEVLSFYHPFVKTRSLKEGTPLSKMKARRSAEFLQPYKPRPDTCPALAKRLVRGALGVKLATSREEREAEKKLLLRAREKKKLEAKQKEDAWEGTFS